MMNDLCIERITDVFYQKTDHWERTQPRTRVFDAAVLFCEGEIQYFFDTCTITARAGDLLLLPGNLPYSGIKLSKSVAFYVLDFECTSPTAFEEFGAPSAFALPHFEKTCTHFAEAVTVHNHRKVGSELWLKAFAYSLLSAQFEIGENRTSSVTDATLSYIRENLHDSTMNVKQLCERFYISESQLRRNLHKATGLNPNEYLLLLRLNHAKNELLCTRTPIKQIAENCGFTSPYYFTRRFTEHFGCSPSLWRKIYADI